MTVTVKHPFVSTVPDSTDTSLVRPSNWNADHTIIGLGTAAELNAGVALGVATLDASGKVPLSEIPDSIIGALSYQGTWNASTNTPTLTSSVGTKGYYYVVNVAGTTNLDGITDWQIGDWAVFNGSVWQKIDNTDAVTSVNGFTGTVVLTTTNIAEGTNLYYTDARSRAAISAGTGISYNSTTGVITNSSPSLGGDVVGPASATDNAIARFDTTTGKLIQNSGVTLDDNANLVGVRSTQYSGAIPATQPVGTMWFDSATDTLNFQQNAITQQIGEEIFVYGRASEAITDGQVIAVTGAWGTTGVVTFAPAPIGTSNVGAIIGIATEPIAKNSFGRITAFGTVHGLNTTGFADGDDIYYDPTVVGGYTKTKPSAPNIKVQVGIITKAAGGTNGSIQVQVIAGTELGGTDSNVQLTTPTAAQILTYSTSSGYWKNTSLAAGTGISVGAATSGVLTVTNSAPDQTVAIASGTGISVTGTYPNFTVTNTSPSSGGTVTSVSGTAPVSVATGTTTPVISLTSGYGDTQNPYASKTANYFLAAPNGSAGAPTFRAVVAADIPTLNQNTTGSSGSCTGNAATVTNGVYTTGSYADPTWITSLAGSKITGTLDGGTF